MISKPGQELPCLLSNENDGNSQRPDLEITNMKQMLEGLNKFSFLIEHLRIYISEQSSSRLPAFTVHMSCMS